MSDHMNARVFLLLMAARMVGDYLYSWGGEETEEGGFDCSGFASVALMQTPEPGRNYMRVGVPPPRAYTPILTKEDARI